MTIGFIVSILFCILNIWQTPSPLPLDLII